MPRIKLRNSDIALLGRLNMGPLELGEMPAGALERLMALGLTRTVLGSCNITRAGQLSFHRRSFDNVSRQKFAYVTRRRPLFLHEARLPADFSATRRALARRVSRAARLFKWLVRARLKHEHHQGSQ